MNARIRRISYYGFSTLNRTEFVEYCLENFKDRIVEKFEDVFLDLYNMKNDDPLLYSSYFDYFVKMKYLLPDPKDDFVFRYIVKYGNPKSRVIFENGSQYSLQTIMAPSIDSECLINAHRRFIDAQDE